MIIIVQNKEIETKDIIQIKEPSGKFHGFEIYLTNDRIIPIIEVEKHDMYNSQKANINDRYSKLKERVIEEWNKDKTEFIVLNL